jgi:DNA-binding HxlR family transcriptional regulator
MATEEFPKRSGCPIASTLDIVGDRWSLVLIRDLINGKSRFGEFMASPEGITSNLLADRLRRLEAAGLIVRDAYQQNPPRHAHRLTPAGEALLPVLQAICRWGNRHIDGTWIPPESFMRPVDGEA